jgi:acylphosphatase
MNTHKASYAILIKIYGLVQGVCFRAYTRQQALTLGITGWVRNLSDGTVEAFLEGDKATVTQMLNWCYKGPPAANVTKIDIKETLSQNFTTFNITY